MNRRPSGATIRTPQVDRHAGKGESAMEVGQASPEYVCAHEADEYERFEGAVVPPIFENSLFVFPDFETLVEAMKDERRHYLYWRGRNPTVEVAERKIAALERGERCKLFSSGMAAISSTLAALLQTGDHVLAVGTVYGPTVAFFTYMSKFGIEFTHVLDHQPERVEREIRSNTRLIYFESPTTMTFRVVDVPALVELARRRGVWTVMDNTWATPVFQNPLAWGVDAVVHSVSKYMGGHSDVVGGALVANAAFVDRVFLNEFRLFGGAMPPFEAWLLTRGLRTLPVRMAVHQNNAMKVARFLENHPAVKVVHYPGLPGHPEYELGRRLLKGYSGLLSFELRDGRFEAVRAVLNRLRLFKIGVSWGGYESLVMSPNRGDNAGELERSGIGPGLIRLSIGLENPDDLIKDLEQALAGAVKP